jgi:phage terminase small subunit
VRIKNLDRWTRGKPVERDLLNGLSRRERTFVLEKLLGMKDLDAALCSGYSRSMARNTKQKIWKPHVQAEFQRLTEIFTLQVHKMLLTKLEAQERNTTAPASAPATPS